MKQTVIYDYLGFRQDPIYQELEKLKTEEFINLDELIITLNRNSIYEVSSKNIHNGFSDIDDCYKYLIKLLNAENKQ